MEELTTSTQETEPTQSTSARKWYEGVSLEDAEIYIRANLKSAARSVIAIGYYLKCVYTKELYQEAGFKDVYEYAKDRFGLQQRRIGWFGCCVGKVSTSHSRCRRDL